MDNWLKNNNVLKVLSVILAIMLWMVVNMNTTIPSKRDAIANVQTTYLYEAKVSPIYNENLYVIKMQTDQINVTLSGNKDVINEVHNSNNIDKSKFFINLNNYQPGIHEVPIEYSGFPSEVNVEISPSKLTVGVEAKNRKEVDVLVDKLGQEADGYQAGEAIVKPKKVHISGTKDQIDQVAFVKAFINIDNVKAPILEQVPLRALDKNGNTVQVEITPQIVEVQMPVASPFATIPVTYKISNYPPSGYAIESITQLTKEVTIYGPKDLVSKYNFYVGPILDLSKITSKQALKVEIPLDKGLLKVEPDTMEFDVNINVAVQKTFPEVQIEANGLSEGLSAEIVTPKNGVSVTLEGTTKVLENLSKDELQAFVDLTNLPPGEYEIPINYNVPFLTKQIGTIVEMAKVVITEE